MSVKNKQYLSIKQGIGSNSHNVVRSRTYAFKQDSVFEHELDGNRTRAEYMFNMDNLAGNPFLLKKHCLVRSCNYVSRFVKQKGM